MKFWIGNVIIKIVGGVVMIKIISLVFCAIMLIRFSLVAVNTNINIDTDIDTNLETQSEKTESQNTVVNQVNQEVEYFEDMSYMGTAEIKYLFHKPSSTDEKRPLIIFLHGLGTNSVTNTDYGSAIPFLRVYRPIEKCGDEYSSYVLIPKTPIEGWWKQDEIDSFKVLLKQIIGDYNIDPKRVYIMGFSMGGFTTCRFVNEMPPNTFAAAVPIGGSSNLNSPQAHKNTAFYICHSKTDETVSVECARALNEQLKSVGHNKLVYIERPDGGHCDPLYDAFSGGKLIYWLFSQKLP